MISPGRIFLSRRRILIFAEVIFAFEKFFCVRGFGFGDLNADIGQRGIAGDPGSGVFIGEKWMKAGGFEA